MWRRPVLGAQSLLRRWGCGVDTAMTLATAAPHSPRRGYFTREYRSPITLHDTRGSYAATLSWQWSTAQPRHLVLRVQPPDVDAGGAQDSFETLGTEADRGLSDYTFGRLFLRPYNVAQLLCVLEGRTAIATITREHAALTLMPGTASSNVTTTAASSSFVMTGHFTAKVLAAGTDAAADGNGGATTHYDYALNDTRQLRLVLRDAELIFVKAHLANVLSDFFGLEHRYHFEITHEALQRQRQRLETNGARGGRAGVGSGTVRFRSQQPSFHVHTAAAAGLWTSEPMTRPTTTTPSNAPPDAASTLHEFAVDDVDAAEVGTFEEEQVMEEDKAVAALEASAVTSPSAQDVADLIEEEEEVEEVVEEDDAVFEEPHTTAGVREANVEVEGAEQYVRAHLHDAPDYKSVVVESVQKEGGYDVVRKTTMMERATGVGPGEVRDTVVTAGAFRSEDGAVTGSFQFRAEQPATSAPAHTPVVKPVVATESVVVGAPSTSHAVTSDTPSAAHAAPRSPAPRKPARAKRGSGGKKGKRTARAKK